MAARAVLGRPALRRVTPIRIALWSAQAGLVSLLTLGLTLSSFGLLFDLAVARGLTVTSLAAGLVGVVLAHEAAHRSRRDMSPAARRAGRYGGWASTAGSIGAGYYLGVALPAVFLFAVGWPLVLTGAILALSRHSGSRAREDAFLAAYDPSANTSECSRCRVRIPLAGGRWVGGEWLCPECRPGARSGGVSA